LPAAGTVRSVCENKNLRTYCTCVPSYGPIYWIWKEAAITKLGLILWHLPEEAEEAHENLYSE
jgi:hypothetical protein